MLAHIKVAIFAEFEVGLLIFFMRLPLACTFSPVSQRITVEPLRAQLVSSILPSCINKTLPFLFALVSFFLQNFGPLRAVSIRGREAVDEIAVDCEKDRRSKYFERSDGPFDGPVLTALSHLNYK
jgi:hypothetical protein